MKNIKRGLKSSIIAHLCNLRNINIKVILSVITCFCIISPVFADETVNLEDFDLSNKPISLRTLDYLHQNNVLIPQKVYNASTYKLTDGGSPLTDYESIYSLKDNVTESDPNVINIYTYNNASNVLEDNYYQVQLKNTEFGDPTGVNSLTFGWEKGSNGYLEFKQNPTTSVGETITVKYTTSELRKTYTSDNSSTNVIGIFVGQNNGSTPGGAIFNHDGKLGNIIGDFINNSTNNSGAAIACGSFAYINNIIGNFINNTGAISTFENGHINNINANFIGNSGTAIYNTQSSTIANITGSFIGNKKAISNSVEAEIGAITADFIGNYSSNGINQYGGAIYNDKKTYGNATIGNITGDFIGNFTYAIGDNMATTNSLGGAIFNNGTLNNILGNFFGNYSYAHGASATAKGGAIHNIGKIKNITGNFIANYLKPVGATCNSSGSVIYNDGTIETLTGNLIANYNKADCQGDVNLLGGVIYNNGTIGNIKGDIIGNYNSGSAMSSSKSLGGVIYNNGEIGDIISHFIDNYCYGFAYGSINSSGGAIYNLGTIGSKEGDTIIGGIINSNFYNNYAKSKETSGIVKGGAIYTTKDLNIIAKDNNTSTFKGNFTQLGNDDNANKVIDDNAIYVDSATATLNFKLENGGKFDFYDNIRGTDGYKVNILGNNQEEFNLYNAFYNADLTVDKAALNLNYKDKNFKTYDLKSLTIKNNGKTNLALDIDFAAGKSDTISTTENSSGVITVTELNVLNKDNLVIGNNYTQKILTTPTNTLQLAIIDSLKKDVTLVETTTHSNDIKTNVNSNERFTAWDEVTKYVYNLTTSTTTTDNDSITLSYIDKSYSTTPEYIGDTLKLWAEQVTSDERNFNFGSATEVYTVSEALAQASAGVLNLNGKTSVDEDDNILHSTIDLNGKTALELNTNTTLNVNNITIKGNDTVLNVSSELAEVNLDNAVLEGSIKSTSQYKLGIKGKTTLNGSVGDADVTISNADLTLNSASVFDSANVTFNGGNLNLINDNVEFQLAKSFNIKSDMVLDLDADLANMLMDRLPSNTTVAEGVKISVDRINLISDSPFNITQIPFAYDSFKESVAYIGSSELSAETQVGTAFAPIYKYGVSYNPNDGMFTFTKPSGKSLNDFNPVVYSSAVAAEAGAHSVVSETVNFAFQHVDTFSPMPMMERLSYINRNKYASAYEGGVNYDNKIHNYDAGAWVRPFTTFEKINLSSGPDVEAITYGTVIGFDGDFTESKHGWYRVPTVYIGYNGSMLSHSGIDTTMNGGVVGLTESFYKNNFFAAVTATTGASVGTTSSQYGHDDFTSLLAGAGAKTGYNFEFKNGKFVLQPIMAINYTFVNTFDYTNAAGTKIKNDPLHSLQVNPQVKFVANCKNGWQPYAKVGFVWNVFNSSKVTADDVVLPKIGVDPYVEYGLGLQKTWKDRFTGFAQAMVRSGGRDGVALTFGFRWAIGKEAL